MVQQGSRLKGIVFILGAAFFFATMSTFVHLAGDLPFLQKSFFRNLIALLIALVSLCRDRRPLNVVKGSIIFLCIRCMAGTIGIYGNFYAIDRIPLSDAAMLNKMSPFFAVIFSYFLLKEKIKPVQACFLIAAFFGAMLVVKPSMNVSASLPAVAGFLGGMGAGCAYACVRKLSTFKMNGNFIVACFSGFSCLTAVPWMLLRYTPMTVGQLLCLLMAGVCGAGGQFCVTAAYFAAPAKEISVFDYSQVIFAALEGFFVFGQLPDHLSFIGCAVIISMGIAMFLYKRAQER